MSSAPAEPAKADSPANDALLAQLVRGALGRSGRGTSGINVSSCSFVITLHGSVGSVEERDEIGKVAGTVPGVEAVLNKLRVM
jgi:osmotically-inducible protein OsmY